MTNDCAKPFIFTSQTNSKRFNFEYRATCGQGFLKPLSNHTQHCSERPILFYFSAATRLLISASPSPPRLAIRHTLGARPLSVIFFACRSAGRRRGRVAPDAAPRRVRGVRRRSPAGVLRARRRSSGRHWRRRGRRRGRRGGGGRKREDMSKAARARAARERASSLAARRPECLRIRMRFRVRIRARTWMFAGADMRERKPRENGSLGRAAGDEWSDDLDRGGGAQRRRPRVV
jgi:hypothetical protein